MKPADHVIPPGKDDWIQRRLADLERQIRELRAERRLGQSTVEAGSLDIKGGRIAVYDDDGSFLAALGDLDDGFRGTVLYRAGGIPALAVYGIGTGSALSWYDRQGNQVVEDDGTGGRGLARPYIPLPVVELSQPQAATTSATFVDVAYGAVAIQHPVIAAYILVYSSDASTTGEMRFALDGTAIGSTTTITAGQYAVVLHGPFVVPNPGSYAQIRQLTLQARRTAGTGSIAVRPLSVLGLESAYGP